jgi:hypothetical protein
MTRTNGCKNWRCRYYDTTMMLHCARATTIAHTLPRNMCSAGETVTLKARPNWKAGVK